MTTFLWIVLSLGIASLVMVFTLQGFGRIPAQPPHQGVVVFWGRRRRDKGGKTKYKNEGLYWYFLKGVFVNVLPVNVERNPIEIKATTRTPDNAEVEITISLTFQPLATRLIEYLNSGGSEGVVKNLRGQLEERLREWVESKREGPMTWEELYASKLEATSVLVKKIFGNRPLDLPQKIKDEIPEYKFLLRLYFSKPPLGNDEAGKIKDSEVKGWIADDWKKLREKLAEIYDGDEKPEAVREIVEAGFPDLPSDIQEIPTYILLLFFESPPPEKDKLPENVQPWAEDNWKKVRDKLDIYYQYETKEKKYEIVRRAVEARRKSINDLRDGRGRYNILDLGIEVQRFNVSDIEVLGKAKEAADLKAERKQELEAAEIAIKNLGSRVTQLKKQLLEQFPDLGGKLDDRMLERIMSYVQVELGKATREIKTFDFPPEVVSAIGRILGGGR